MLLIAFASCKDDKGTDTEDQEADLAYTNEEVEI